MARTKINRDAEAIDWEFRRGDTWIMDFTFATSGAGVTGAIDLSGSTWLCQIREGSEDGAVWQTATVDTGSQSAGYIVCKVEETATSGASIGSSVYYYDLQQTLNNDIATPVAGRITVTKDVSRP